VLRRGQFFREEFGCLDDIVKIYFKLRIEPFLKRMGMACQTVARYRRDLTIEAVGQIKVITRSAVRAGNLADSIESTNKVNTEISMRSDYLL